MKYWLINLSFIIGLLATHVHAAEPTMAPNQQVKADPAVAAIVEKYSSAPDDSHSYYSNSPLDRESARLNDRPNAVTRGESSNSSLGSFKSDVKR